ncbi:MAG TPA: class I SAM-dependent methyltransferase [Spirochaetia bacterium]|nr:class I SAM-dependent methyltransferase [Spirochaetia bacterium]
MDSTIRFYDENAARMAARYEQIEFGAYLDRFLTLVSAGSKVLEIGSGSGKDAARLLAAGMDVTILDGSRAMLDQAVQTHPELAGHQLLVKLPGRIPVNAGEFDAVLSRAMIMHIERESLSNLFREIARVIKPGGVFAYSVNTSRAGIDANGNDAEGRHFTCLDLRGWEALHSAAGFLTIDAAESDDLTGRDGIRWVSFFTRKSRP